MKELVDITKQIIQNLNHLFSLEAQQQDQVLMNKHAHLSKQHGVCNLVVKNLILKQLTNRVRTTGLMKKKRKV